jgi:hypothetical protein
MTIILKLAALLLTSEAVICALIATYFIFGFSPFAADENRYLTLFYFLGFLLFGFSANIYWKSRAQGNLVRVVLSYAIPIASILINLLFGFTVALALGDFNSSYFDYILAVGLIATGAVSLIALVVHQVVPKNGINVHP